MAREAVPGDTIVQLAAAPRILGPTEDFPGMWEYAYDVVGTTDADGINYGWTRFAVLHGIDTTLVANRWNDAGELWDGTQADPWNFEPKQRWSANAAGKPRPHSGTIRYTKYPSYWGITPDTEPFNFGAWHQPKDIRVLNWQTYDVVYDINPGAVNQAWYTDNPWHTGFEYPHGSSVWDFARAGVPTWTRDYIGPGLDGIEGTGDDEYGPSYVSSYDPEGISFENLTNVTGGIFGLTGLLLTFRIVHPNPPGEITWTTYSAGVSGTIVGPMPSASFDPGDVDEDGDIDADDIDLMADYIRTGIAPTTANYDLSDDGATGGTDGNIDLDDLDYLVRFLVETSAVDGDGNPIFGTQYGDFNLDGEIELGDLTRLGTYYGVGDKWAEGNANRYLDELIELGDLTILGTYYGASNGGVDAIPEPMTMSLLAVGACLPLFRRKTR